MSVLRVLWMSTHRCFAFSFPLDTIPHSDDGAHEMEYAGDDYYTTAGAYYYVENADAQE